LCDSLYDANASGSRTWPTLAVINAEFVLEISERTVSVHIIAKRRAAGFNRVCNDFANCRGQLPTPIRASPPQSHNRTGLPPGIQARAPQCLTGIDVAEAGYELLIEKCGFRGVFLFPNKCRMVEPSIPFPVGSIPSRANIG